MLGESDVPESKETKGENSANEETRTNNEEDEVRNERNVNFVCTEDEIGVTLDYQPPNLDSVNGRTSSRNVIHSGRRHRSRRRPSRSHESSTSGCGSGNPWIVPFFSGIFTGLIFLIIGIVFVIYFRQLPNYIGILFILVSIPPFCMAINKYRTAKQRARMQRRAELRRQVIRDMRSGTEGNTFRSQSLPFSDLPPAYTNFAFDSDERDVENAEARRRGSSWSTATDTALPSYVDAVKPREKNKLRKSSNASEYDLPKYEEAMNETFDDSLQQPSSTSLSSPNSVASIPHPSAVSSVGELDPTRQDSRD